MIRNYFADLELQVGASLDDVKHAYKKLARKFHPDLNPLDFQAEESFRRIQAAFEHLSTETRIHRLSKHLEEASGKKPLNKAVARWGNYPLVPESPATFATDWGDEPSTQRSLERPKENLDFWISVDVSAADLKKGCVRQLKIKYERPCQQCRGSGGRARAIQATCKRCAGLGHLLIERGAMHWKKTCNECLGKGFSVDAPCSSCTGKGKVFAEEVIEIRIPKNADLAKSFALKGSGHISFDGKTRGDVWVQLAERR